MASSLGISFRETSPKSGITSVNEVSIVQNMCMCMCMCVSVCMCGLAHKLHIPLFFRHLIP